MQFAWFEKYLPKVGSHDLRGGAEIYSQIQRRRISNLILGIFQTYCEFRVQVYSN